VWSKNLASYFEIIRQIENRVMKIVEVKERGAKKTGENCILRSLIFAVSHIVSLRKTKARRL
jgi:hypothetical protein